MVLRAAVLCSVSCSPSEKRSGECLHAGDEEESVDEGQMCGSAPRCVWDNACRMHGSTHPYQVLGIRGMKHCLGTASKPNCLKVMVGQPCSAWCVSLACAIVSVLGEHQHIPVVGRRGTRPIGGHFLPRWDPVLISGDTELCMNKGKQVCSYFYVNLLSACLSQLPWSFVFCFFPIPPTLVSFLPLLLHLFFFPPLCSIVLINSTN